MLKVFKNRYSFPSGIRSRVNGLKGKHPRPLDDKEITLNLELPIGFEPMSPSKQAKHPRPLEDRSVFNSGIPSEIRTRVTSLKGWCPNQLDDRDMF